MTSILGDGVAANCCAHLLNAAGMRVTIEKTNRPKIPALLIGNATQALMEDVFRRADIFRGAQRISKRIVAWGSNAEAVEIPHSAVVISEQELADRLTPIESSAPHDIAEWTIVTSRPLPDSKEDHHFGSRIATAVPVQLKEKCSRDACWIESLEGGWLFLLPGWLLAVGASADLLLAGSRMVSAQIESLDSATGQFPAYPRVSDPLCGSDIHGQRHGVGWLACGGAAMAFDPICGDGTGHAIREAILACAVIKASTKASKNIEIDALFAHYRARLIAGFLKHLELCRQFYAACSGEWWATELNYLDSGIAWCRGQLGSATKFQYQLRGFDLEPRNSSQPAWGGPPGPRRTPSSG